MPYVNNKDTDQPAHPCSLIIAFVVPFLDSIMPIVVVLKFSRLWLALVVEQAGLSPT